MQELKKLGLTNNEIDVYLAILKQGETTIQSLVSASNVKRTTIYSCLERLKKLALITEGKRNKKRVFLAETPEKLIQAVNREEKHLRETIKEKRTILETLIPQLMSIEKKAAKAPKIRFYEGIESLWNIADDYFHEKTDLYILYSSIKLLQKVDRQEFKKRFTFRRRQIGKTKVYNITDREPDTVKDYFLQDTEFSEYRFLPAETNLGSFVGFYGEKVFLVSFEEPIWGVIIESKELIEGIKFLWDIAWKSLEGKNLPEEGCV